MNKKLSLNNDSIASHILINSIALLILFGFWFVVSITIKYSKEAIFPTPLDVMNRIIHLCKGLKLYNYTIIEHLSTSLLRWGIGYILSIIIGISTGILLGTSNLLYRIFMPIIYVIQLIPGLAWVPIALLIFGIGNISTIFMIFVMGYTPIVINTAGSIRSVPPIYSNAARIMGANKTTIFLKVFIPATSLSIINGLRIGLANAWRVLIAAEMIVGVGVGLGYIIIQARWSLDFEAAFASITIIVAIGLIIEKGIFRLFERNISRKLGIEQGNNFAFRD